MNDRESRDMTRRRALALLFVAAGGTLILGPGVLKGASDTGRDQEDAFERFRRSLDPASVRRLADTYTTTHPEEADPDRLIDEILAGAEDSASPAEHIRRLVAADFANGDMIQFGVWTVSRTEARLLTIVALG